MSIVTINATLGEDGLMHSLTETNAKAIFVDPELIPMLLKILKSSQSIKFVLYHGDPLESDLASLKSLNNHLTILHYDALIKLGRSNPVEPVPPNTTDLACIMYTSGSSGRPKGVLLTHRNLIAAGQPHLIYNLIIVSGIHFALGKYCEGKRIRTLGYLPLAHIYGFVFELVAQYWGATIGYARYRTLTDSYVRNCKSDLREFKPHLLPSYGLGSFNADLVSQHCGKRYAKLSRPNSPNVRFWGEPCFGVLCGSKTKCCLIKYLAHHFSICSCIVGSKKSREGRCFGSFAEDLVYQKTLSGLFVLQSAPWLLHTD